MLRMAVMGVEPAFGAEVRARAVVADETVNRTLPGLACAIQARIYGNRHADFAATPLLAGRPLHAHQGPGARQRLHRPVPGSAGFLLRPDPAPEPQAP